MHHQEGRARLHLALVFLLSSTFASIAVAQDVPYEPTSHETVRVMLRTAEVRPDDFVVDLGSGDGRIVIAAARDFGARALGIEIDPTLLERSRKNAARAGVQDRVEFRRQDLFETDLQKVTVLTLFLWPDVNLRLRPRILAQMRPGTRVVSHEHDMGDWDPDALITIGDDTVYLWIVPANVEGTWLLSIDGKRNAEIRLKQKYQSIEGRVIEGKRSTPLRAAELRGDRITLEIAGASSAETLRFEGKVQGDAIQGALDGRPATMHRAVPGAASQTAGGGSTRRTMEFDRARD